LFKGKGGFLNSLYKKHSKTATQSDKKKKKQP